MSLLSTLEELRDFDTALLANTIENIDPTPAHEYYMGGSIRSVTPALGPTVGVAMTCELDSSTPGGTAETELFWRQIEAMQDMNAPVVWVVRAAGSRPDHECILGDGMAKALYAAGCVGAVTNGGVRDVAGLLTTPFAAYCKGITIHHCPLRYKSVNKPVEVGGITIHSGDVIHAGAEGVIKIPKSCLDNLPAKAIQMRTFEHAAHGVLRRTGLSVSEKRRLFDDVVAKYGLAACTSRETEKRRE